jgi:hypothetical protein
MKCLLTKIWIIAGLVGALALSTAMPALAKSARPHADTDMIPNPYTCEASWFYPGYYCYLPNSYYYGYPAYYAYGSSYSCTAATWNGWQWVPTRVC